MSDTSTAPQAVAETATETTPTTGAATTTGAETVTGADTGAATPESPSSSASSLLSSASETSPGNVPLDPQHDPHPVLHWLQEGGPGLWEAAKALLGFAFNWFL